MNAVIQAIILAVFKWQTRGLNAPLEPIWLCVAFGVVFLIGGFVYLQKSRKLEANSKIASER